MENNKQALTKLSKAQLSQLDDIVRETRFTRGKNKGSRKPMSYISIDHFDMRSLNKLISERLITVSEYNGDDWYATDLGYTVWMNSK